MSPAAQLLYRERHLEKELRATNDLAKGIPTAFNGMGKLCNYTLRNFSLYAHQETTAHLKSTR
jgi:hypothetical protein